MAKQAETPSTKTAQDGVPEGPRHRLAPKLVACGLALATVYGGGCAYFSTHFTPGTTVNGQDVSLMTKEALSASVADAVRDWRLELQGPSGFTAQVASADVGLAARADDYAADAFRKADARAWPLDLLSRRVIFQEDGVTLDEASLRDALQPAVEAYNQSATAPTSASSSFDADAGEFRVTDEVPGTMLDLDRVVASASTAAKSLQRKLVLGDAELVQPAVRHDDERLAAATKKANDALALSIPLTRDGREVARVDESLSASWLVVGDDLALGADGDAIGNWINSVLAASVDYSDEVNDYAVDDASLAESIYNALLGQRSDPIEIPLQVVGSRPAESEGARERGRHIDINLSTQYARFYDANGRVIWRSYIVSGNTSEGRTTPTGTYAINSNMARDTVLVGADEDHDGEPDYRSNVSYWMPFIGNSVGLHDATWRYSFGGSIYSYAGSHGCVNLPYQDAKALWDLVRVGDKVVVHW
ncbi:L,D-transpeptidase [Olsenella phocaeensis]|uniref:L,D-transpeptidase n=1 Tax=Olsenella phocaeensis TaxID=1852385 RepID=UPI003A8D1E0A